MDFYHSASIIRRYENKRTILLIERKQADFHVATSILLSRFAIELQVHLPLLSTTAQFLNSFLWTAFRTCLSSLSNKNKEELSVQLIYFQSMTDDYD